ncbi:BatD family protein [Algibacter sp. 2305UL17-15]|uniref:BatD family protein n=1 Tax=Algibacter sp. 2305UL17-15 TaxID=3231268 RepID=UPI003459B925
MNTKILALTLLLLLINKVIAQVSFKTIVKQEIIAIDDEFSLDYVINKKTEDFEGPNFKNFKVVSGPSLSASFSTIKGKRSYQQTYTYKLRPLKLGEFTIPNASCIIQSKKYSSQSVNIKILSLKEKIDTQTTAFWNYRGKGKLVLVDKNKRSFFNLKINLNYDKIHFYKLKKDKIIKVSTGRILPKVLIEDVLNVTQFTKDGYKLLDYTELYDESKVQQLIKPENNGDLVFEISYSAFGNSKKVNEIELLKKYSKKRVVFKYKRGRFVLKN